MGYFSEYAFACEDNRYVSDEMQLLWRLSDLRERYKELRHRQEIGEEGVRFSKEELRYVLPEDMKSVSTVVAAIETAIETLREQYGIDVEDMCGKTADEKSDVTISFVDMSSVSAAIASIPAA